MRILHDPSIFERKPLNFFNRSGETVLFRRGKKDREEAYSMGNSQSLRFAFCCTYGSRQFASGFYHDRRISSNPVNCIAVRDANRLLRNRATLF